MGVTENFVLEDGFEKVGLVGVTLTDFVVKVVKVLTLQVFESLWGDLGLGCKELSVDFSDPKVS
jgi:hypothetical protein